MSSSTYRSLHLCTCLAAALAAGLSLTAKADPARPDPCKLITVAEIQQIVGPLAGAPQASAPGPGVFTCTYTPAKGPSYIDINVLEGDLAAMRSSHTYKDNAVSLPEFGKDAFANSNTDNSANLCARKGNHILQVMLPTAPAALDTAKAIAKKALVRL
jgi:hypothetical protein